MANSYKQPPIKNKKNHNQIYSLQLEPLINKDLRWATVATFLDDNFGVFHCFYPPVSNHFVFIPTINHCLYYTTQNMRNMNTVNLKNAFFKGFSFTVKGANHFTCAGWVISLKKKKKFWKLFILVRKISCTSPLSKQTIMHIQVYNRPARKTMNFIFLLFS